MIDSFLDFIESAAPHFPYQGGKFSIRNWVLSYMPKTGRIYVEPFVGKGNMFFLAKSSLDFKEWHINDLNTIPFFDAIQSVDSSQLPQDTDLELFNQYKQNRADPMSLAMEPAIAHTGHYRGGFAGRYGKNSAWDKRAYGGRIDRAKELLKDVKKTNVKWQSMPLRTYESVDFIYLDPPYYETDNRYYKDGADEMDHSGLLTQLKSLRSRWLLSHTWHEMYVDLLGEPFAVKERPSRRGDKLVECLWKSNY